MSTENSRADALTYRMTEFDVLLDGYQEAQQDGPPKERADARNELRRAYRTALLTAPPVEQPAAAPIDPTDPGYDVETLREHVRHLERRLRQLSAPSPADEQPAAAPSAVAYAQLTPSGKVAFFDGKPMLSTVQNECFPVALGVLSQPAAAPNVGEGSAAEAYASCAGLLTAPSPADEREALSDQDIYDKFSFLEGLVNESTYVRIADTAIEIARAASANETGAEPTACKGKNCGSLDPRFHSAECFEEYEKTVGLKPAMADVRVGLTDEQRNALKLAIGFIASSARQDRSEHVARIRALLDNDRA